MEFKTINSKVQKSPARIFLIDAIGALITLLCLVAFLNCFQVYIGMPREALYLLIGIASSLFVYSICCHILVKGNWELFLKIVISGNIIYGVVSILLILIHFETLTILGLFYFILEKIIIAIIVYFEWVSYSLASKK